METITRNHPIKVSLGLAIAFIVAAMGASKVFVQDEMLLQNTQACCQKATADVAELDRRIDTNDKFIIRIDEKLTHIDETMKKIKTSINKK